jgi:LPS-assembly protein
MTKTWGAIAVVFASTNAIAGTVPAPKLCSEYLQPKNWQPLSALPKDAIDIQADDVEMQGKDSAEFSGNVEINTNKMSLQASSALIDKKQSLLNATGPLNYQDPFTSVRANALYANLDSNEISLLGADYQLTQQQGRGGAEKLSASDKQVALINSSFTTCPSDKPFWALEADNITLSKEEGWGETHSAVLKILDAPVLYIPYFTFPIDDRRKSGLLMPKISPSSHYGLEIALPYYWNIAPNYDATITPRYMANQGVQLITEFRYLTEQHQGLLGVEFLEKDDSEPSLDERYLVHWNQQS